MSSTGEQPYVETDRRFKLFGSHVRVLIGPPAQADLPSPEAMGTKSNFLRLLHRKLTRFEQGSELCALNSEPGESCSVSPTLAAAVNAALWAARRSDGLVDPTLVAELEEVGYVTSRADLPAESVTHALAAAPNRAHAGADADSRWTQVAVDVVAGTVTRPPGVRIDTGGCGRGPPRISLPSV